MEPLDVLKKEKLVAALKFVMDATSDSYPALAVYADNGFRVEVSLQHNDPRAAVSILTPGEAVKKKTDIPISEQATQYLQEQHRILTLQSRLRNMTGIK